MNEPRRWTFLCIWYENRGCRVYEVERLCFRSTWPCVYPSFYGSVPPVSTRITVLRVLTSFVPPVHNQGAGSAPNQGLALRKIFLPATGSFFVLSIADLIGMLPGPAPCGGRYPGLRPIPSSFPVTAGFNPRQGLSRAQSSRDSILASSVSSTMLSGAAAS